MSRRAARPLSLLGAAAVLCATMVLGAKAGRDTSWSIVVLPVVAFLAARAAAWPVSVAALGLLLAGVAASELLQYDGDALVPEIMLPVTLYTAGVMLRSRETLAARLARQGEELTIERDAYARLSVRYERARIAAELHDVVAHAISVMVVQAGAGQRLARQDPARAAQTFGVIASAARQAQADLDRLADLLGQDARPSEGTDLGLVHEIVRTAGASGLPVTLSVEGDLSDISGPAAHVALRVVQEGLTNALRYAPGASVAVVIEIRPGSVEITVANDAPLEPARLGLGSGRGLTGLRERIGDCGGTLEAHDDGDGGWRLSARIPTRPRAATASASHG
jgi:signal transduction histidine kinase